jgi:hypothetical protein
MLKQPQREQRLDEKAASKRVETEQHGEGKYDPPRGAERTACRLAYKVPRPAISADDKS